MFDHFTLDGVNNTDPELQYLRDSAFHRRAAGVQGADRRLSRRVRPQRHADQRAHQVRRQPVSRRAVRVPAQRQARRQDLRVHRQPARRRIPSSGTSTASSWTDRFAFRSCSTARTGCSSWPTTRRSGSAAISRHLHRAHRRHVQAATSAASPTSFTIPQPPRRHAFPGNVIPADRIDPDLEKASAVLSRPPISSPARLSNNYRARRSAPINKDQFISRMDFVESPKSHWSGRYSWGDENQSNEGLTLDGSKILTNFEQYMGSNTRIFSPNVVNEARFGYTRFYNSIGTLSGLHAGRRRAHRHSRASSAAIRVQWGIPNVTLTNYSGIGDSTEGPYANNNNTLQFVDNLPGSAASTPSASAANSGASTTTRWATSSRAASSPSNPTRPRIPLTKTGGDTFADFLLGDSIPVRSRRLHRERQFRATATPSTSTTPGRSRRKLTLSLGLRYELTPPFYDTPGNALLGLHAVCGQHAATSPTRAAIRSSSARARAPTRMPASQSAGRRSTRSATAASATAWCRPTTTISRRASASPIRRLEMGRPHRRWDVL